MRVWLAIVAVAVEAVSAGTSEHPRLSLCDAAPLAQACDRGSTIDQPTLGVVGRPTGARRPAQDGAASWFATVPGVTALPSPAAVVVFTVPTASHALPQSPGLAPRTSRGPPRA